jgi:hypothetical protein
MSGVTEPAGEPITAPAELNAPVPDALLEADATPPGPAVPAPAPGPAPAEQIVAATSEVWRLLGGGDLPAPLEVTGPGHTLPSRLPVTTLAATTVAAATLAAVDLATARGAAAPASATVDTSAVATAFTSERLLRVEGHDFTGFAPLSRFWTAADGRVRTHGNYPHHRSALLAALDISEQPDSAALTARVGDAIAALPAEEVATRVTGAGGLAVVVRTPDEWRASPQGAAVVGQPLLSLHRVGDAGAVPLAAMPTDPLLPAAGIRVLDFSRVLAGPVATRTLALLGADVLRVDTPNLPEDPDLHQDTGLGKRSTLLDLDKPDDRARLDDLLSRADVVVTGYRPGALSRHGLGASDLLSRYPSLVVGTLSAWGTAGPWSGRRGFDSLVQAACGIAAIEADAHGQPGALPAQALDHGSGYLLAAAVLRGLAERTRTGGGWHAEVALARTAQWLTDALPPTPGRLAATLDANRWCATTEGPGGRVRYALPPVALPGGPTTWAAPATAWGSDEAAWR